MALPGGASQETIATRAPRFPRALDLVASRLCAALLTRPNGPDIGVELWNGERVARPGSAPLAQIRFGSPSALLRCLFDPEVQLPECYVDGAVDIDGDVARLMQSLLESGSGRASLRARLARLGAGARARRRFASLRNARHHYDLSNEFYALWLDSSMTYTCAYFPEPSGSLEKAQEAKLDLVCRKLGLVPGQHVIEAGCGWGSLALHMARHYGVTVAAYNLSREQLELARARAAREGLSARVAFIEDDYRNLTGHCDAFVAVGMLEHVPREHYSELGRIIRRSLAPEGRALVHTIGRHRSLPPPRWTTRRIFPGGNIPSLAELSDIFEPNDLCVLDVENLRLHYAKTLEHWLTRFEAATPTVAAMFDERFVRMWRFYLASALAGFRSGWLQLFQVTVTGRANDRIPWTRRSAETRGMA